MEEINPYHVKDREHRGRDTILIVDDIEVNRIILQSIFERDYNLLEAENGEQAMVLLKQYHGNIAAVLLDLVMPEKDGYEVLQEMGAEIEKAENGQIAVDMFADHPENYYDFILMDVQMPVMDGRTAARTIRAMERPDAKSILIFALSADAFVEDERLSIESGMNGHYAKPVDFQALQRNIGKFLQRRERRS